MSSDGKTLFLTGLEHDFGHFNFFKLQDVFWDLDPTPYSSTNPGMNLVFLDPDTPYPKIVETRSGLVKSKNSPTKKFSRRGRG